MGLCMALNMNSVEFWGKFGAAPGFLRKSGIGAVRGNLGVSKGLSLNLAQTDAMESSPTTYRGQKPLTSTLLTSTFVFRSGGGPPLGGFKLESSVATSLHGFSVTGHEQRLPGLCWVGTASRPYLENNFHPP